MNVPEAVITERDAQMYEAKKQGLSYRAIGKAFGVSEATAWRGCKRVTDKIIKQLAIDHGAEVITDLQRLESLYASFAPLARPQKMMVDGEEITIPPSPDAAKVCLQVIDKRARFLNYEQQASIEINIGVGNQLALGSGEEETYKEATPEKEGRELLKVMREAGVIDEKTYNLILEHASEDDVVDAEVVEDSDHLADLEPPEFVDAYDDENPDDHWEPEF